MQDLYRAYAESKPYFGELLGADQGTHRFKYFPRIVDDVRKSAGRQRLDILEIGSWAGGSAKAWDLACAGNCNLTCVDNWKPHLRKMQHVADEAKRLFYHNMRVLGIEPRLRVVESPSEEALFDFEDESFDIVFIDADHRYQCIRLDIHMSKELVREGGVICGDDLEKQVHEIIDHTMFNSALGRGLDGVRDDDNVGYHPGVTLAVFEEFGRIETFEGLWVRQKVRGSWEILQGVR